MLKYAKVKSKIADVITGEVEGRSGKIIPKFRSRKVQEADRFAENKKNFSVKYTRRYSSVI